MIKALEKFLWGLRVLYYEHQCEGGEHTVIILKNSDILIVFRCTLHACSNAVKWSTKVWATDFMKGNTHIALKSLRNGSQLLHERIEGYLESGGLQFHSEHTAGYEQCHQFFQLSGD